MSDAGSPNIGFIRISLSKKAYGGNFYENLLDTIFNKTGAAYVVHKAHFQFRGYMRIFEIPKILFELTKISFSRSLVINNFISIPLMPFVKNGITIIHHIDSSPAPLISKIYLDFAEFILRFFYSRTNHIVVISKYWFDVICKMGFTNVHLIYCGLPIEKYLSISDEQVQNFIKKYDIPTDKPIVYIGNPQACKGYHIVYEELKNQGYTLVSSGLGEPIKSHLHFNLDFEDYLCLLKASSCVVTFSQFKEGWCLVANEGALCATPVIGSGTGGMGELLESTGQTICKNRNDLKEYVKAAIAKKSSMTPKGTQYSLQRFEQSWQMLIQKMRDLS